MIKRPRISAKNSIEQEINNKIHIFEEDDAMSLLLSTIFDLQGYEVQCQKNFSTIDDTAPTIAIIDAGSLDNPKGLELCRKLRQNPIYDRTKIVVTSIFHDKETILNAGADLYIPKPYEITTLVKWIEKLTEKY